VPYYVPRLAAESFQSPSLSTSPPIPATKPNERPSQFVLDDEYNEIVEVEDRWYEPEAN
jgi:hypothetical protein